MFNLKSILAIVDFRHDQHYALPRAIELAHKFDLKITVISNIYETFFDFLTSENHNSEIKANAIRENRLRLKALIAEQNTNGLEIELHSIWSPNLKDDLSRFINEQSYDLVLKTTRTHNILKKLIFTPTDWHLLRDTKTNILFVKKSSHPEFSNIIGAINIDDDTEHKELNEKIIIATTSLAQAFHCKSNILNVFPWTMVQYEKFKHLFKEKDFFTTKKERHEQKVKRVVDSILKANSAKLNGKVIIAEGLEPEDTIPSIIKSTKADLLVMGTVGRSGLEAAVIGNTAEKILDDINCEVLAIK